MFTIFGLVVFVVPAVCFAIGWLFGFVRILPALVFLAIWTIGCEALAFFSLANAFENPIGLAGLALAMVLALIGPLIAFLVSALAGPVSPAPAAIIIEHYDALDDAKKAKLGRYMRVGARIFLVSLRGHLVSRGHTFCADILRNTIRVL